MFKARGILWSGWVAMWATAQAFDEERAKMHLAALRMLSERHRRAGLRR